MGLAVSVGSRRHIEIFIKAANFIVDFNFNSGRKVEIIFRKSRTFIGVAVYINIRFCSVAPPSA